MVVAFISNAGLSLWGTVFFVASILAAGYTIRFGVAPLLDHAAENLTAEKRGDVQRLNKKVQAIFLGATLAIFLLWISSIALTHSWSSNTTKASELADSFGMADTLFSGLAFVGVVIAIVLQTVELRYQRMELTHQHEELMHSRIEQRRNARIVGYSTLLEKYVRDQSSKAKSPIGDALCDGRASWASRQIHQLLEAKEDVIFSRERMLTLAERRRSIVTALTQLDTPEKLFETTTESVTLIRAEADQFFQWCKLVGEMIGSDDIEQDVKPPDHDAASPTVKFRVVLYAISRHLWVLDRICLSQHGVDLRHDEFQRWWSGFQIFRKQLLAVDFEPPDDSVSRPE